MAEKRSHMENYSKSIRDHLRNFRKTDEMAMTDYLLQIRTLSDNLIASGSR